MKRLPTPMHVSSMTASNITAKGKASVYLNVWDFFFFFKKNTSGSRSHWVINELSPYQKKNNNYNKNNDTIFSDKLVPEKLLGIKFCQSPAFTNLNSWQSIKKKKYKVFETPVPQVLNLVFPGNR